MVQLTSQVAREPVGLRCPYCHDLIVLAEPRVECAGCDTPAHEVCMAELGRCTVLGCARPVGCAPGSTATRTAREEAEAGRLVGFRARVFRAGRPGDEQDDERALQAALRVVEQLERSGRRGFIPSAPLARVHELEARLGGGSDRADVPGWLPLARLRERLASADRVAAASRLAIDGLVLVLGVTAYVGGAGVLGLGLGWLRG